jgi:hypothetical protein
VAGSAYLENDLHESISRCPSPSKACGTYLKLLWLGVRLIEEAREVDIWQVTSNLEDAAKNKTVLLPVKVGICPR